MKLSLNIVKCGTNERPVSAWHINKIDRFIIYRLSFYLNNIRVYSMFSLVYDGLHVVSF